ncbi:MAG: TolC family protein [Nitrospiraceae bacterium]|nr:TolC family protein [Nitrospiraceae bacterium]
MNISRFMLLSALLVASRPALADPATITLQDAYTAALTTHESIKMSEESLLQAESRTDQAKSYIYPRVTAMGSYTRYNDVLPPGAGSGQVFQPLNETRASLVLQQPLYTGGRTLAAWRLAKMMKESSSNDLAVTRQEIMLGVSDAYYAAIKAQKLVEVSVHSLERIDRHKKVAEHEAVTRRTKTNQSAFLRANSLVNQGKIALVRSQDGLQLAKQKLSLITRVPEDVQLVEPAPLTVPGESLKDLKASALQQREEYRNAELNRKTAEEFVTITRGGHYPQLYAEAGAQYVVSSPETLMDGTTYYGGLRLQIPLFEGGLKEAEVAESRSKQRQADYAQVLLQRKIESDVEEALIRLHTQTSVLETAKLQYDDAKKNFEAIEGLYAEGLATNLSMIDAEQAITFAESELVSATWDREAAIARLQRALGILGKENPVR